MTPRLSLLLTCLLMQGGSLLAGVRNLGDPVPRKPLTPTELLVQSLMLSNEFI